MEESQRQAWDQMAKTGLSARALWWVPRPTGRKARWRFVVLKDGVEMARMTTLTTAEKLAAAIGGCAIEAFDAGRMS